MLPLAESAKQALLDVARRAVILAVERRELLENLPDDEALRQLASAFVTLHRMGRLRGCVGQLASKDPLVSVVAYCAMAAALDDPRFAPMTSPELEGLAIEISVLSPLVEISSEQIEPGKHGLMITRGGRRGVLLPQVAEQFGWTAERFLEETCLKADLERDDWKQPGTVVQGFTAEIFSEAGFRASPRVDVSAKSNYSTSM
ncbi:MAG TPA: AmmeMemoRadiSam system protein A [Candidatus Acidoferrales bacterium]|jgi:AmmeMemoRadiSam system protein A